MTDQIHSLVPIDAIKDPIYMIEEDIAVKPGAENIPGARELFLEMVEKGQPAIVCFGTEVYAIVGDPFNDTVDDEIRKIKERGEGRTFGTLSDLVNVTLLHDPNRIDQMWHDLLQNRDALNNIFGNGAFIRFPSIEVPEYPDCIVSKSDRNDKDHIVQFFSFYGDYDAYMLQEALVNRIHHHHEDLFDIKDSRGKIAIITSFNISRLPSIRGTEKDKAYELARHYRETTYRIFHRTNAGPEGSYPIIDFTIDNYEKFNEDTDKLTQLSDELKKDPNELLDNLYNQLSDYKKGLYKKYEINDYNDLDKLKEISKKIGTKMSEFRPELNDIKVDLSEYQLELLKNNYDNTKPYRTKLPKALVVREGGNVNRIIEDLFSYLKPQTTGQDQQDKVDTVR
jgi:hypothetical protein